MAGPEEEGGLSLEAAQFVKQFPTLSAQTDDLGR